MACVIFASCQSVLGELCAICGEPILGETIYIVTDKSTEEKKHICYSCSTVADECFVCGLPVKKNYVKLSDGRYLCARDAKLAVLDAQEAKRVCEEVKDDLDKLFSRFTVFPKNVQISIVDRVDLVSRFKLPGNDFRCPNILGYFQAVTNHERVRFEISIMSSLTRAELKSTCAHEYTHAWVAENVSGGRAEVLSKDAQEGFCELVSYLLMESQNEEGQKKTILRNGYTRGQIDVFLEAQRHYGLNDIIDWVKYGVDEQLTADELTRLRAVEMPRAKPLEIAKSPAATKQPPAPDKLLLKGIFGTTTHPIALINNEPLGVGETGKVRVGQTNVLIRCLGIERTSVRIKIVGSGEESRLTLRSETK